MYPYYALFSEERRESEEARGWFRDGMHFPEPMFPFDFVTADSPYMCLGQANSRIFAVPPALGIDHRVLYGWVYMSANPVTDEAEIGRRAELFGARAGYYFQNWDELYGRWRDEGRGDDRESSRRSRFRTYPRSRTRRSSPRVEGSARRTRCCSRTTGCSRASTGSGSTTSSSSNLGYAAYLVFYELCKQSFPDIPDQAIAKMVSGIDVVLFRPDTELKRLAGRALELGIADARRAGAERGRAEGEPRRRATRASSGWPTGRRRRTPWFYYSNGNGFYHHHRSWIDDPTVPLAPPANYVRRLQAGEDLARPLAEVSAERDRITAEYRALLADERDDRRVRSEPRPRPHRVPVRREPQLLRRALVPHDLLEQGPRVRRAAGPQPLHRGRRGHLLPPAPRALRRARRPAARVGGRLGGPRRPLLAADRRAAQADHGSDAGVHAAAGAGSCAGHDHRADDDHAVGHHDRARAGVGRGGPRLGHRP